MIPKVIHFCWLSNDPFPLSIQKCIDSWKKNMPDYEIKRWSTENFDINSVPLVKEAFETKKYALLQIISVAMHFIPRAVFI